MPNIERARIADISAKVSNSDETLSVPWQNNRLSLKVINLSLDSVVLNPESHRIRAQIESHARADILEHDPFSEAAQEIIATILAETVGFAALVDSLQESGQLDAGIITHAGVLVNANTRAVALRQIGEEYIRVGVLPDSATEKEITEVEARLQLARDYKQEYTLTNELLFIKEQIEAGRPKEDLAMLLGKAQSRNAKHLKKGVSEIEKSLRILQHIREVQDNSGGAIPLTFFDPHESALAEADSAYISFQDQDPDQARRVRDGRLAGILVGVTYRNLRHWDSDEFLRVYVEPQFEGDESLLALVNGNPVEDGAGGADNDDDGLGILEGLGASTTMTVDPSQLLVTVAGQFGASNESEVAEGLTKEQLQEEIQERLTQAAEERAQDKRDERRQSTPIKLVREARQKVDRARKALKRATLLTGFKHGKLSYEMRMLRRALNALAKEHETNA